MSRLKLWSSLTKASNEPKLVTGDSEEGIGEREEERGDGFEQACAG